MNQYKCKLYKKDKMEEFKESFKSLKKRNLVNVLK